MGATLYIVPINPANWQNITNKFRVDSDELRKALQQGWPDTEIEYVNPETDVQLRWRFQHKGIMGGQLQLYSDGQCIALRPDLYSVEFILWFRKFVPQEQPLFLDFSPYPETRYLELTENTTQEDIKQYIYGMGA